MVLVQGYADEEDQYQKPRYAKSKDGPTVQSVGFRQNGHCGGGETLICVVIVALGSFRRHLEGRASKKDEVIGPKHILGKER